MTEVHEPDDEHDDEPTAPDPAAVSPTPSASAARSGIRSGTCTPRSGAVSRGAAVLKHAFGG